MRIGQCYLIHCGDWHTFVGRVVAQIGPGTYELECVSKISETNNGDCWGQLAAGNKTLRKACSYVHTPRNPETKEWLKAVIPLVIAAFEWVGKLPQEEKP